jgi:serine/threonine protein kinase/TolB-like protein
MSPERWQKVEALVHGALEVASPQRGAWIERACAGDASLRAEVEKLLRGEEGSRNFLEAPAVEQEAEWLAGEAASEGALAVGQQIGAYRIRRELGRGGMGAVYLAERADDQYRKFVAIKIVRRDVDSRDILRRFRNECQILASLDHPNIARLIDGGRTEDGRPYLVMEYVEGTPVTEYCDQHRLTTNERLQLFRTICAAVHHAHQNLVVHRDIKPSNILITTDGTPKLLDFGIAKVLNVELSALSMERTRTELRALTPDYASPEQVRGEKLTATSDVYSLGVVLYELLTGHRPYRAGGALPHERARVICEQEPLKPSAVVGHTEVVAHGEADKPTATTITPESVSHARLTHPDKLRRSLSGDLDNIVLMALRKEQQRRYESAAQLSADIGRHLDGLPVIARKDTLGYRTGKTVKRNKALIVAAAIVVIAFLVGMSSTYLYVGSGGRSQGAPAPDPLSGVKAIAVLPFKSATTPPQDQELRVGLADSIAIKLSASKQLAVRPASSTVRYLDQNYDVAGVGRELKVDSILEGSVRREADRLDVKLQIVRVSDGEILWAESFVNDLSNVLSGQESVAYKVSRQLAPYSAPGPAENAGLNIPNTSAQEVFLKGNYAIATSARKIENIFTARAYFEQAIRLDPNFALAHAELARTYTLAASLNLLSPRESYPKAERAARRALEIDPNLASAYVALAEIESDYNWNWQAADAYNKRALGLAPNSAATHHSYSEFLARMGRFDESARHSDLAQELDPTKINYKAVRALHYFYEHRFDDTIAQSRKAIEEDENAYLAYLYLSIAQATKGRYDEGIKAGEKAGEITGGAPSDLFVLGCNYALANDKAKTDEIITRLQSLSNQRYVEPFFFVAIYAYRGDKDKAIAYMEKSYAEKSYWMTSIKVHPVVDALRSDPRFIVMLQKMNLDD